MKSHRDLDVWRAAIKLSKLIYEVTRSLPKDELYGLTSQMRRACVSIAANIAEGSARQGTKELIQFTYISAGSANELDTHLEIAKAVGYLPDAVARKLQQEVEEVLRMLRGLIRALKKKDQAAP